MRIVRQVSPSVVLIETTEGLGSGVVYDDKGDIVTNNHVVGTSSAFKVTLANGKSYNGQLVGTFAPDDLAVIHIDATGLQPAVFADSSKLQVGDITLAIGNPLGLRSSVTDGIVSALGRTVNEENGVALPGTIQTSAAINPGNSGGALVNLDGQVIGIPTLAAVDPEFGGAAAAGIGFAISSNTVADIANQLIKYGQVVNSHRAFLGVTVAQTTSGGVLVAGVQSGGPADQAGLQQGDTITSVAGQPTPTPVDLAGILATLKPGQSVAVGLTHPDGSTSTVTVVLGEYPGSASAG